ncbi:MAG TPA: glycosyltransferase [Kofleriaceae bacterium]|nr:glycosyltransferase [Kofleriaceae bacterium]
MAAPRLRVDVALPARDAEATLPRLLDVVTGRDVRAVVVVDRGSTDGTAGKARDRGAIVLRAAGGGYGAACLRAMQHFAELPEPPDVVAFVPADAHLDHGDLGRLVAPLASLDAELTLAVRPGHGALRDKVVTGLIHAVYGHRIHDPSPVRAIRYPALVALGMSDKGDGWNVEMLVRALRLGLGVLEVDLGDGRPLRGSRLGLSAAALAGGRSLFHILRHATVR